MRLSMKEVVELLGVSEKALTRFIKNDELPAVKVGGQYHFNRTEILEWATQRQMPVSSSMFDVGTAGEHGASGISLQKALIAGGIRYGVGGNTIDSVLETALDLMPIPESVDKTFILQVLKAREAQCSTGIGDGIAIPHVRNPIIIGIPEPMITLCFLQSEIDFGALDGQPVHTLFMMISPMINLHLGLLSRLAFALRQPAFIDIIRKRGSEQEILCQAGMVDIELSARQPVNKG
jgi:PTS system nitrogen regulatory IIA component